MYFAFARELNNAHSTIILQDKAVKVVFFNKPSPCVTLSTVLLQLLHPVLTLLS